MATTSNSDEVTAIATQKQELLQAKALVSDSDLAFRLQLQEALTASLTSVPSSSSSSPQLVSAIENDDDNIAELINEELEKLELEKRDRELTLIEAENLKLDLRRRIHDQNLAYEIIRVPDDEWDEIGDIIERPFDDVSKLKSIGELEFRLYFKGFVSVERAGDTETTLSGIGVAICDSRGNLIFQLSKPLPGKGMRRQVTEIKALIEGLETALTLDLKRITIFCSYLPIYRYAMHTWKPKQRKVAALMAKVNLLEGKFTYCRPVLVSGNDIKFAFKLARDAITSQMSRSVDSNHRNIMKETCVICLEEIEQDKMFTIDDCQHKYCFSCMRQHVEAKLHNGFIPKCPHENCKYELNVDSCEKFLTPKLIEIMKHQVREASVPVAEKVYCPYPRCSALMSKAEASDFSRRENVRSRMFGARKCVKCHGLFCINCRVPWHKTMTCSEYKKSNLYYKPEDAKLKSLATRNLWRQCVKCKHMIELVQGCYHMTCRCGNEFCYLCGAEWKKKEPTCSCPLWSESNLYDDSDFDDDDDDDDDDEDDDSDFDGDYYTDSDAALL